MSARLPALFASAGGGRPRPRDLRGRLSACPRRQRPTRRPREHPPSPSPPRASASPRRIRRSVAFPPPRRRRPAPAAAVVAAKPASASSSIVRPRQRKPVRRVFAFLRAWLDDAFSPRGPSIAVRRRVRFVRLSPRVRARSLRRAACLWVTQLQAIHQWSIIRSTKVNDPGVLMPCGRVKSSTHTSTPPSISIVENNHNSILMVGK